jgi:flagellar biosynthesis anti-sigma factor FlgM
MVSPKVHSKSRYKFAKVESGNNLLSDVDPENRIVPFAASPDEPVSSGPSSSRESTTSAQIFSLLDQIRALDKEIDEARIEKIAAIKKALADGTYHVSADEVARKILDHLLEP